MSSFCKCFFSKNINVIAILNDQSFNDTLTNDSVSIEQLGPAVLTTGGKRGHVCISNVLGLSFTYSLILSLFPRLF